MRTIKIGFSKPHNRKLPVGSWAIRAYLRTNYSHTYISFYSEKLERELIYEAMGKGTRFVSRGMWNEHNEEVEVFEITLSDDNYKKLLQFCIDCAGSEYGFLQNLGIFIADILNMDTNPFKEGVNCSEMVGLILESEGYELNKESDLLTPKDINEILKNGKINS